MSPTASERVHTLDDEKLDEIGYPQTRAPKLVDRGPRTVEGPTASPPRLVMPQPKHAVPPTQKLVYQQPAPALAVNNQGNNHNNTSAAAMESSTSSSSRTYTTAPMSADSEGDRRKPGNKSVVTSSTGINPKPTPSSLAPDNSHKAAAVRPQGILVRKPGATNASSPSSSSLRKSLSATSMNSSSSQPMEYQPRLPTSLSNAALQKQHQQQSRADATPAASVSYNKVTFDENVQKQPKLSPEVQAILDQNALLRDEVDLLRSQQETWRQSKRELERGHHLVANRLEQLEERLRLCFFSPAANASRSEEKGKAVAHPTHSRSDPTTASPRKPPSGGGRSPASKRHRSKSLPRFEEEVERYAMPQPRRRYDDYEDDYEDYAGQQESTDDEEDGWEEYSNRRLPPPPMMRHHHHHPFPRYAAPPVVPLAGPSLPPPQLPPLSRKWEGSRGGSRGGSLRRQRSGSKTPFLPMPVPHYHALPPRHHGWRDSGYDAAEYAWDEPPHRSSRYYDEPSDDYDEYPPAQKRYPHDRRLSITGRERRTFPYGSSM